jgi:3-oxoacyl-[acyl-carrier protein] reductase
MKGKILNISSIFGTVGKSKRVSYSSSKWGLIGLTKSSSLDLAKYNILVNAISPGVIESDLTNKILGKKGIHNIKKDIPLNRLASIDEIINVISFLVSDKNSYMTGQNIVIDGGFTSA